MQAPASSNDDAISREIERVISREANAEHLRALLENPGSFDGKLWALAVGQGWPGLALDESLGGLGLGWRELADTVQVLGHATVSLPLIQCTVIGRLLTRAKNAQALKTYGEKLASGDAVACIALLESGDAGLPSDSALVLKDGKLCGTVARTSFAVAADVALVRASRESRQTLALVALDGKHVTRDVRHTIDNARAAASLTFTDAPATELEFDSEDAALTDVLAVAAVITAFEQIGGASACLELARAYALEHKAFGQPIGAFQAIKHKLADIYTAIEIARGCALEALEELERDQLSLAAAAAARIAANRAYDFAAQEAIQVHGGMGITWEAFLHHHYRRARSLALELGSSAYWRNQLLAQLINAGGR